MPHPQNGYSTRGKYDKDTSLKNTIQSEQSANYIFDTTRIYNNNTCFSPHGPFIDYMGEGGSVYKLNGAQNNIEIDSMMSMRGTRYKKEGVNTIDIKKIPVYNLPQCNTKLETQYTKITDSAMLSKGSPINLFYTPPFDPQKNIYFPREENTRLTEQDKWLEKNKILKS